MCELTKKCINCKEEKTTDMFSKNSSLKYGVSNYCRECHSNIRYAKLGIEKPIKLEPREGHKFCSKCKEEKPYNQYVKSPDTILGLSSKCKTCAKIDTDKAKNSIKLIIEYKECNSCSKLLPKESYHKNKVLKDGYNGSCKECVKNKNHNRFKEVTMKTCYRCGIEKTTDCYYTDKSKSDNFRHTCKTCTNEEHKERRLNFTEEQKNKEREYCLKKETHKRATDPLYRFSTNVTALIRMSFKSACKGTYIKSKRSEEILGCTMQEFQNYLISQFEEGMTMTNHGMGEGKWNIDHIIPSSSAKTEEDIYRLNHHTNLRPMWAIDNIKKGARSLEEYEAYKKLTQLY